MFPSLLFLIHVEKVPVPDRGERKTCRRKRHYEKAYEPTPYPACIQDYYCYLNKLITPLRNVGNGVDNWAPKNSIVNARQHLLACKLMANSEGQWSVEIYCTTVGTTLRAFQVLVIT